jgi:O-antigen ligase
MREVLRDPMDVCPGGDPVPRFAGPAAGVGLDLLCCLPAMLVLLKALFDRTFTFARCRSVLPMALLSGWMLLSTAWASDKYAALVLACHWTAATVLLWAVAQLVRDWVKLRLVAAVSVGLLPVFFAVAWQGRTQTQENVKYFEEHKAEVLSRNGIEQDSFAEKQFERKIKLGESFGFFTSPNTFGGAGSLLMVITLGLLIQAVADGEKRQWAIVTLAVLLLAGVVLMAWTRSRGAVATLGLAAIAFLGLGYGRGWLARRSRMAYAIGVAVVVLGVLAVVGHGIHHGRLPTDTLTFRWQYWVGSAGVFRDHPIRGIGWGNFGLDYLVHRLPVAPEEVKDPHNLLVRFFVELGLVGGALAIAWLAWLWWELTRPTEPDATLGTGPGVIKFAAAVAAAGFVIYLIAGVDWAHDVVEDFLFPHLLYLGILILVPSLVALRLLTSQEPDDRPAPWVLYGLLLGAGGMLIHNLIDFSLFEPGLTLLFAVVAGAALGARQAAAEPHPAAKTAKIALPLAGVGWLAAAALVWVPLVRESSLMSEADEAVRAGRVSAAATLYEAANRAAWGMNADDELRVAAVSPPGERLAHFRAALRESPHDARLYSNVAEELMTSPTPDAAEVKRNYETALRWNPNDVPLRLRYADALAKLNDPARARAEYAEALRYNDMLDKAENKRLTPKQIAEVHKKMDALAGATTSTTTRTTR